MPKAHLMLLAIERVEDHPINETLRLVHLFLATVKLQPNLRLTLLHLPSDTVDGLFQNFKDVDRAVEISDLTTHRDEHSPHKDPKLLLHLLRLYQRSVEVNLFEFE
jgi:hypothetical protein